MPDGRTPFQRDLDEFERRLGEPEPSPPKLPWLRRTLGDRVLGSLALGFGLIVVLGVIFLLVAGL